MYKLLVLLFTTCAYAQRHLNGACNNTNIDHLTSLNATAFTGKWYQVHRIPYASSDSDCASITLTPVFDNGTLTEMDITSSEVANGKLLTRNGTITWGNDTFTGELRATYTDGTTQDYLVLDTDYNNYAVMYSCKTNGTSRNVWAWKLGRSTTYSFEVQNITSHIVEANPDLSNTTWKVVQHTESHCKLRNSGINLQISPVVMMLLGLALAVALL